MIYLTLVLLSVSAIRIPLYNYGDTMLPFSMQPFVSDVPDKTNVMVQSDIDSDFEKEFLEVRDYICSNPTSEFNKYGMDEPTHERPIVQATTTTQKVKLNQDLNMIALPNSPFSVIFLDSTLF